MICPTCGAELVRGFSYCLQCGAPVPDSESEEDNIVKPLDGHDLPGTVEGADITQNNSDIPEPEIMPFQTNAGSNSDPDSESLVFCPNCGLVLQDSTGRCSKCGMILGERKPGEALYDNSAIKNDASVHTENQYSAPENEPSVPLFAPSESEDELFSQSKITQSDLDDLAQQLASFSASVIPSVSPAPSANIPEVKTEESNPKNDSAENSSGKPSKPKKRRRAEYKEPEAQVEDFTMKTQLSESEHVRLSNYEIPVIEGADMEEDSSAKDVDISGYAFTSRSMDDISFEDEYEDDEETPEPIRPTVVPEPIKPVIAEPEPINPVFSIPEIAKPEPVKSSIPEMGSNPSVSVSSDIQKPTEKAYEPEPDFIPEEFGFIAETPFIEESAAEYEPPKEPQKYEPPKEPSKYEPPKEPPKYEPPKETPKYEPPKGASPAGNNSFTPINGGRKKGKKPLIIGIAVAAAAVAAVFAVSIVRSANKEPDAVVAEKPSGIMSSDKTASLDEDRRNIMMSAVEIAGEVGKADILAQQVIRIADASEPQNVDTNVADFYKLESTQSILSIVKDSARTVGTAVMKCSPKNTEYNPQYMVLTDLKKRYDIIAELVYSPAGRVSSFKDNYEKALGNFNSELNMLGFSVFINSDYTDEDKKNAYYFSLCDAQECVSAASSSLSSLRSSFQNTDKGKFKDEYFNILFSGGFTQVKTTAAQAEAYSVMLSNAPADYEEYGKMLADTSKAIGSAANVYNTPSNSDFDTFYAKCGADIGKISDTDSELKKFAEITDNA